MFYFWLFCGRIHCRCLKVTEYHWDMKKLLLFIPTIKHAVWNNTTQLHIQVTQYCPPTETCRWCNLLILKIGSWTGQRWHCESMVLEESEHQPYCIFISITAILMAAWCHCLHHCWQQCHSIIAGIMVSLWLLTSDHHSWFSIITWISITAGICVMASLPSSWCWHCYKC